MKSITNGALKLKSAAAAVSAAIMLSFLGGSLPVFAHGGAEAPTPQTVANQAGTITRVARAGELEVMLKNAAIEPDTPSSVQLFVTRFATNEPFADAKPSIEITSADGKAFEVSEAKTDAPGSYSFSLPALPQGNYTILTRINAAGNTDTATFSGVEVAHPASDQADASASGSWLRTMAVVLAAIVILALFAGLVFFATRFFEREERETVSEAAVSV